MRRDKKREINFEKIVKLKKGDRERKINQELEEIIQSLTKEEEEERRKKTTEGTPGNEGKSVEEMAGRQEGMTGNCNISGKAGRRKFLLLLRQTGAFIDAYREG